jgi:hypothetical protein
MFAEPLSGFRQATTRPQRTKVDWALEVAHWLDTRYADYDRLTLVCDNLNTHTKGASYEAFEPGRAHAYLRCIEFCYTPKHGRWLNIAACELSCMTSHCRRGRRIGELEHLQSEIRIWSEKINAKQRGVDWQFQIDDARQKLKRLYQKFRLAGALVPLVRCMTGYPFNFEQRQIRGFRTRNQCALCTIDKQIQALQNHLA